MTKYNYDADRQAGKKKKKVQKESSLCIYAVRLQCADELTSRIGGDKRESEMEGGWGATTVCC